MMEHIRFGKRKLNWTCVAREQIWLLLVDQASIFEFLFTTWMQEENLFYEVCSLRDFYQKSIFFFFEDFCSHVEESFRNYTYIV